MALVALAQPAAAADATVRTPVAFATARPCDAPVSVAMLARTYFEQSTAAVTDTVAQLLDACHASETIETRYVVILFAAKRTPLRKFEVVHLLYDAGRRTVAERNTLPGIRAGTWIYVSDDQAGKAVVQLSSVAVQNPVLGQLGRLASTIVPKLRVATPAPPQQTFPIYISASMTTTLPFTRATMTETDSLEEGKAQIDGSAIFTNQPRTWLTVNAGTGVFVGARTGARRVKVESKTYVNDPLARGAAFAGVTFHAPYDASRATPGRAERWGLVVAAVLTPSLGLYAGPSFGWRGLALTAGWTELWVNVPPPPKQINDAVDGQERLATGRSGRALVAVHYAFGS